jgi:acyl-coenzyme A thioesterase PaaI-like protein
MPSAPGSRLLKLWRQLSPLPGGQWLFAQLFSRMVPYSGSVGPRIRHLEPGHARVEIPDRRSNRQHLGSVHAIALMNVAEMASGLAMMSGLPDGVRGIVTSISIEYLKKARGTITAVSRVTVPTVTTDQDFDVISECLDREQNVVARATVRWRLGPVREKGATPAAPAAAGASR